MCASWTGRSAAGNCQAGVWRWPLGFFLPQEERYTLSKGLLNKRNQELRAARCLAARDGEDVTTRKWLPSKDQREGRGGLISKRSSGFHLMGWTPVRFTEGCVFLWENTVAETLLAQTERVQNETKPLDSQTVLTGGMLRNTPPHPPLQRCAALQEKETQKAEPRNTENYSWGWGNRGNKPKVKRKGRWSESGILETEITDRACLPVMARSGVGPREWEN